MPTNERRRDCAGTQVAIVVSRLNDLVTKQFVEGAQDCLRRHEVD